MDLKVFPMVDGTIYIVSPRKLENELLSTFLEQKTGSKCLCVDHIEHLSRLQDAKTNNGPPKLLLFDCVAELPEKILERLQSQNEEILSRCPVCLFRLKRDLALELMAMKQGVIGFFYEDDTPDHFLKGVRALCSGELWITRETLREYVSTTTMNRMLRNKAQNPTDLLTRRELEILALAGSGATNDEIAAQLCISPHTVKTHIYNIFKKIDVPNRLQATLWAANNLRPFNAVSQPSSASSSPSAPTRLSFGYQLI